MCLAVGEEGRILLASHYETDVGPVQWVVPGGRLAFGESLPDAVVQEFLEQTGLQVEVGGLLCASEVILSDRLYHSISIAFPGRVTGGELRAEPNQNQPYGQR